MKKFFIVVPIMKKIKFFYLKEPEHTYILATTTQEKTQKTFRKDLVVFTFGSKP